MTAPLGPQVEDASGQVSDKAHYVMHLFVAGDEPNSRQARDNLERICTEYVDDECEITVTDVLEEFDVALEAGIFMTPALIVSEPGPAVTIFGNLKNTSSVLSALGLEEIADA